MNTIGTQRRSVLARLAKAAVGLAVMTAATSLSLAAPASAQVTGTVYLYADINYGGGSQGYGAGSHSNIGSIWNDRASSIRVPAGTVVSVYEHGAFGGRCENFRGDDNDLRNNPIGQDSITSLKVGQACPQRLWDDPNYGGSSLNFFGDIPDLGAYGFSDRAESLHLAPGNRVALFDQPNYGGLCEVFTADDSDLGNNVILTRTSSLRLHADCPNQALLFEHINYGGAYYQVPVSGAVINLEPAWRDRASSIYLTAGTYVDVASRNTVLNLYSPFGSFSTASCDRVLASRPDLRLTLMGNDVIDFVAAYNVVPWGTNQACTTAFTTL